ncbi:hypothetical protein [Roseovarius mucosus]|uniref:hypothetical protein n=1 Tax=Roseovarius mucosus TaxID=215743 RepID=UPI003F6E67DE
MAPLILGTCTLLAAIGLGAHGAYCGAVTDACLKICNVLLEDDDEAKQFNYELTPSAISIAKVANWVVSITLLGALVNLVDMGLGFLFIAFRLLTTVALGVFLKRDVPHGFLRRQIYSSIVKRETHYAKMQDGVRQNALADVRFRFEKCFPPDTCSN